MPIYDYRCPSCGKIVELLVRTADAKPPACPTCDGETLERMPSAGYIARFHASAGKNSCCGGGEGCDTPGSGCTTPGSCCCG